MKRLAAHALLVSLALGATPFAASAADAARTIPLPDLPVIQQTIAFYDAATFTEKGSFTVTNPKKGLSMALTDFGADGRQELVVGAGVGEDPAVQILRQDGSEIMRFAAYAPSYRGGVNVAVGDLNADGKPDIVTGSRQGGGPHVRAFSGGGKLLAEWFAYDASARSGVNVAVGEIEATKTGQEVVTAPGAGEPGLIRVFSARGERLSEWYPFEESYTDGVSVSVAPNGWIVASQTTGPSPLVRVFNGKGAVQSEFFAYDEGFAGGVQTAAIRRNGQIELVTVPGFSGGPQVRLFSLDGVPLNAGLMALDGSVRAGLSIAAGDIDGDGEADLAVGVNEVPEGPANALQVIVVDLSQQRLWTYERGNLVKTYLISSGIARFPTPTGEYSITLKRDKVRMSWFYGTDSPYNYDLKDVPWVMTFQSPFNIHGAYWHNNFGHVMSHGCVNMAVSDAKEVYDWVRIGAGVLIQP